MSLNCPTCGSELHLSLAQFGPQSSLIVPQRTAPEPEVEPQSDGLGEVRSSSKRLKYRYLDQQFLAFWKVYPRRVGKASAYSKWLIVVREVEPQIVIDAAAQYAKEVDGLEPQYVKYPEGWLTAGRWDDEAAPDPSDLADRRAQAELDRTRRMLDGEEDAL